MSRVVLLLAFVAVASAHHDFKTKCPMVPGKYPFDMEKFQGDWYLHVANEDSIAVKGKCGKINFPNYGKGEQKEDMTVNGRYTGVSTKDNKPIAFEAFFQPMFHEKMGLHSAVFRAEGTNAYTQIYKQSITTTDYTTYAVLVSCKTTFDGETKTFGRKLFGEIWTRKDVTLSKDTLDTLTNLLTSYDIEPATIKHVEHNC